MVGETVVEGITALTFDDRGALEMARKLVEGLSDAIEKRDSYSGGHPQRVLKVCVAIAKYLPLTPEEKRQLTLAAILHDIGKVGIADNILSKNGELTKQEMEIIRDHPHAGAEIVGHIKQLRPIIPGIQYLMIDTRQ